MHNSSEDANAVRNLRSALSVVGVGWQPITGGNFKLLLCKGAQQQQEGWSLCCKKCR